tara:strand:- start:553 stop:798 length:246 start_codon:yes stop_codon:yes gene_type:complete
MTNIDYKEIQNTLEAEEKKTAESMYDVRKKLEAMYHECKGDAVKLSDMYETKGYKSLHNKLNRLSNEMEVIQSRLHAIRTL